MMWRLAKMTKSDWLYANWMFDTTKHDSDTEFDIEFNQQSKLCQKC